MAGRGSGSMESFVGGMGAEIIVVRGKRAFGGLSERTSRRHSRRSAEGLKLWRARRRSAAGQLWGWDPQRNDAFLFLGGANIWEYLAGGPLSRGWWEHS